MKGLKVLELFGQGYSYRKIAKLLHLSLRDVSKLINLAANKSKPLSNASIHDLIILEYHVSNYRHELRDLKLQKKDLKDEVNDLREQKYDLMNQVRAKQSELDALKKDLQTEKFFNEILKDISTEGQSMGYS
jgi:predicted  nucleic acid-binding Zn-ribbon protein